MIRPRQMARFGTFHMHEAILDVLLEHYPEGYGIGAAEISHRLGVYREHPMNDAIVTGYLFEMEGKQVQKVQQENGKGGWRLTEEEYQRRRDDM